MTTSCVSVWVTVSMDQSSHQGRTGAPRVYATRAALEAAADPADGVYPLDSSPGNFAYQDREDGESRRAWEVPVTSLASTFGPVHLKGASDPKDGREVERLRALLRARADETGFEQAIIEPGGTGREPRFILCWPTGNEHLLVEIVAQIFGAVLEDVVKIETDTARRIGDWVSNYGYAGAFDTMPRPLGELIKAGAWRYKPPEEPAAPPDGTG